MLEAELRVADHRCGAAAERVERLERQAAEAAAAARQLEDVARRLAPLAARTRSSPRSSGWPSRTPRGSGCWRSSRKYAAT